MLFKKPDVSKNTGLCLCANLTEELTAGLRGKWRDQVPGKGAGQGQPALARAGGGGGGATTHPIGRPSVLMMAGRIGVPLVRAVLGPTRRMALRGSLRARMRVILERRRRAILLRNRLEAEEARGPLTLDKTNQLRRTRHDINDASRQLGERASEHYVKTQYPTARQVYPTPGTPSRAGDFDQVWRVPGGGPAGQDLWVVVESKGGGSPLGTREIGGTDYEQGTKRYFEDVAGNMQRNGEPVGTDLINAQQRNAVLDYRTLLV